MHTARPLIAFGALTLLFLVAAHPSSQGPLFAPAPGSPVPVGPESGQVVLADINRDGHLDMVTRHLLRRIVAVWLGDGKSHFAPAAEQPMHIDYEPGWIALGDVNNDGMPDLGVARRDSLREAVDLFLGDGRGGFSRAAGAPFTVSASVRGYKPGLHFMDINKDGNLDIVPVNGRRNTVTILLGDGRGGFMPGPAIALETGRNYYSFAFGDVDGDGHLDVVAAISEGADLRPGRVVTKLGNGKGAFRDAAGSSLSVPPDPRVGPLADVNGDGRPDLVLNHGENRFLSVLLNENRGRFAPAAGSPFTLGMPGFAVVAADVNRDGNVDLLTATVRSVTVLLGNSRGFVPAPGSPFRAGPGAYHLTVGDVNEDGRLDIAASSFEGNAATVLLGR
jgi:hypothetical protein